jgi:LysR family transcriptional regulator, glycine cleavage system transcriptional activator
MKRLLPPLNALRAFDAAARHNSFTGAAAELRVSHAAISRHVRQLEARLGVALFRKLGRGVTLTDDGAAYLEQVAKAFDIIGEATESVAKTPASLAISVSAEPIFAARWLVPHLAAFQRQHDDIEVFIDATPNLANLERDEADIAIRYGCGNWSGLKQDLITAAQLYAVGSPKLLGRRRGPPTPVELASLPLLHEDRGDMWRRWFIAAGAPKVAPSAGSHMSYTLTIDAAIAGQGLALVHEVLVQEELTSRRLMKMSDVALEDGSYWLVWPERALRRKPVAAFRDWILAESAGMR